MYLVIGDYAAGMLIAVATVAGVRAVVWPGMDMVVAMFLGMALGMAVAMLLGLLLAPLLGMFQSRPSRRRSNRVSRPVEAVEIQRKKGRSTMMKGKGSPILVMVGLVFLGGWLARAEPPVTLTSDEITEEDGSEIPSSRRPPLGHVMDHEQVLQENHEVMHQDASDTHHHDSPTGEDMMDEEEDHEVKHQNSGMHQNDSDTGKHMMDEEEDHEVKHQDSGMHQNDSDTGKHMMDEEGMGSHSEDTQGPMGDGNVEHSRVHEAGTMGEPDAGMMSGSARGHAESEMRRRRDGGMMGGGRAGSSAGGMHGGH